MGEGVWRWGKREIIYLSLHCRHQNDSCIKRGSDVSNFNVSLIVGDKVTKRCPQTTTFEEKGEPKRIRTEVPLLTSLTARPNRLTVTAVIRRDFITSISGGQPPLAPPDVHPVVVAVKSSARYPEILTSGFHWQQSDKKHCSRFANSDGVYVTCETDYYFNWLVA